MDCPRIHTLFLCIIIFAYQICLWLRFKSYRAKHQRVDPVAAQQAMDAALKSKGSKK